MEFRVLDERDNPLLKRKELTLMMNYNGATPSKAALQQVLAKDLKTEPNRVEICKVLSENGKDSGRILLRVWESKDIPIYGAKKEEKPAEAVPAPIAEAAPAAEAKPPEVK